MPIAKILLLEDDKILGETILEILQDAGYSVDLAVDGSEAADLSYDNSYNLYIFDIDVPKINGIDLLKDLRYSGDDTPTIYTSALVDLDTISKGFNAGAMDYLKKPFYPQELLIRVDAKMKDSKQNTIVYKSIEYHPSSKEIFIDGKIISLGSVQIRLFDSLMNNIGKVTLKEDLLDLLEQPSDTALRVAMTKLKQKLGIDITNVRGLGYILEKT
jgi:DNA-binding response OmpR family regulator